MPTSRKRTIPRPVHFETTIPVVRRCACGVWFAAGVAEGIKAEVELIGLDTVQRLWCVCNRIQMYCLRRTGLVQMDPGRLSDPRLNVTLFPQHYCHVKWPQPPPARLPDQGASDIPPY
jgi:hypothetical protein